MQVKNDFTRRLARTKTFSPNTNLGLNEIFDEISKVYDMTVKDYKYDKKLLENYENFTLIRIFKLRGENACTYFYCYHRNLNDILEEYYKTLKIYHKEKVLSVFKRKQVERNIEEYRNEMKHREMILEIERERFIAERNLRRKQEMKK